MKKKTSVRPVTAGKQNRWIPYLLVLPAFCLVMLVVAYPIVNSFILSFQNPSGPGFSLENYLYFFTSPKELENLGFTLYVVLVTVVLSVFIAYLLALYLRFSKSKIARIVGNLYLLPRFVPSLVAVYAMVMVIRDAGVLSRIAQALGYELHLNLMYHGSGLIVMNLWFNIPFAAMIIAASLSAIPDSVMESARDVGAGKMLILRRMILPLSAKDVLIAATFVFMTNVGSFTTPYLMGGNHPQMLGISLFNQFNKYMDYGRTAALSVIMFIICSFSAAVYIRVNLKTKDWEA